MSAQFQDQRQHIYAAIDLKSFYASVECRERSLDPLGVNLVVADASRTEKTICLAVSPSLKKYGMPGRIRLFEVIEKVKAINAERRVRAPGHRFTGESYDAAELEQDPSKELSYIIAPPRMALYIDYSTRIYDIYLKYIAPEDIHVYSIDEVFMDLTEYLKIYGLSPRKLVMKIIQDVFQETGITATAGIGTNLYLSKVAMDIVAKHIQADKNGVRIAKLDEMSYRRILWNHEPLTDFWRVGRGYAKKLWSHGLYTMGDIARCSLGGTRDFYNEELLYRLFGVNAELLIDHAWGWEPCTIAQIKAYKPEANSISSGQVLQCPYDFQKAKVIVREMTDMLILDLVEKKLMTDQLTLTIGYDRSNLADLSQKDGYLGPVKADHYGRLVPKHAHGTTHFDHPTSSTGKMIEAMMGLYDRIVDPKLLVRRVNVTAENVLAEEEVEQEISYEQMSLFGTEGLFGSMDLSGKPEQEKRHNGLLPEEQERNIQEAILSIKKKYGKNAILRGTNLREGATARERNQQIGGHKS